jgi:hypothetical protein
VAFSILSYNVSFGLKFAENFERGEKNVGDSEAITYPPPPALLQGTVAPVCIRVKVEWVNAVVSGEVPLVV